MQVGPGGVSATTETKKTEADGSGTSKKTSVGGERGDGKIGGTATTSTTNTNADGGTTTKGASGKGGISADDKGIGGYGEGKGSVERKSKGGVSTGAVAGLNANIVCNVLPGAKPGTWALQTTINLGALDQGVGGRREGRQRQGRRHRLGFGQRDDERHPPNVRGRGGSVRRGAEDGLRLAEGDGDHQDRPLQGLARSAEDVPADDRRLRNCRRRRLDEAGDTKTIGRKVKGGAGISADAGPIGIEASAEKSDEREMTVTKDEDGSVAYDTKQGESDKKSVGGKVSSGIVEGGASVGKTVTTSTGYKLTVQAGTENARQLQDQIAKLANAKVPEIEAFIKAHPEVKVERSDVRDDSRTSRSPPASAGRRG